MSKFMRTLMAGAVAVAALVPVAAQAGSSDGKIQVKVLGTAVLPDGKLKGMPSTDIVTAGALGTTINTKASDNFVPTLAVEYFFTPNISAETICCFTSHHVNATGAASGKLADDIMILPATLTLKYHLPLGPIKPYVGAGPAVFFFLKDKVGATGADLGATSVNISDKVGVALQAGVDIPVNDQGLSVSLDAKRYFMRPTAHFYAGSTEAIAAKVKLDPWVLSAGVAYRF